MPKFPQELDEQQQAVVKAHLTDLQEISPQMLDHLPVADLGLRKAVLFPPQAAITDLALRRVEAALKQNLVDAQRSAEVGHTRQMLELGFATIAELVRDAQGELARVAGPAISVAIRNLIEARLAQSHNPESPGSADVPGVPPDFLEQIAADVFNKGFQSPGPADVPGVSRDFPVSGPVYAGTSPNTCELDRTLQPAPSESGCISLYEDPEHNLQICLTRLRTWGTHTLTSDDCKWLQGALTVIRHA